MIEVVRAAPKHAAGICRVCAYGWRATYKGLCSREHIERIIAEFYNRERVPREFAETGRARGGWFVAVENGRGVGAGEGGMTGVRMGEVLLLHVDPGRRK
jgi:hypothetical protein